MPQVTIIAGANGSGKSTVATRLLSRHIHYLNADEFAKTLKAKGETSPDMAAGRLLLGLWDSLTAEGADFAVETTLATRSFAPRLKQMQAEGYRFHLVFIWIPNYQTAIERVQERVRSGGHFIPDEVVQRRYAAGLKNFFTLYRPLADTWRMLDNSIPELPTLIARGTLRVQKEELWKQLQTEWDTTIR